MSDFESIFYDSILDMVAQEEYEEYQLTLQEEAESLLEEVLSKLDVEEVLDSYKAKEPVGDGLNAALHALIDALRDELTKSHKQRMDALSKANAKRAQDSEEAWSGRLSKARILKQKNPRLSNREIAKRVIKKEIRDELIFNEKDMDYLENTVAETLRKKLGKDPEINSIK